MIEKLLKASPRFYLWVLVLIVVVMIGAGVYCLQLARGLSITGMSRDVSWGLYISQFVYFVGVAASAVMLVLPLYFHHYKKFKRLVIFGEFMAIAAVLMCMLFILVDLGQPQRVLNVILHPSPRSVMFWDMVVLSGYLLINAVVGWVSLEAERHDIEAPRWSKHLATISIFWAFSIHTVTAFLIAGLPGRHYWLTAIMAARFLASAFCSGPAIFLLLMLLLRRLTGFEPGREAIRSLSKIIVYALGVNIFFYCLELFTAFYSGIPSHGHPLSYLFTGHAGHVAWVSYWMWIAVVFAFAAFFMLAVPSTRENERLLPWSLLLLVAATWIDKGLGLLIGGFTPTPFETITLYTPTLPEVLIAIGVYGIGALALSLLWKIALDVKREAGTFALKIE